MKWRILLLRRKVEIFTQMNEVGTESSLTGLRRGKLGSSRRNITFASHTKVPVVGMENRASYTH